jgi:hypothetical protein
MVWIATCTLETSGSGSSSVGVEEGDSMGGGSGVEVGTAVVGVEEVHAVRISAARTE